MHKEDGEGAVAFCSRFLSTASRSVGISEIVTRIKVLKDTNLGSSQEDIRTAAHSPKGDESHLRHCVEDERMCNTVGHIPIG